MFLYIYILYIFPILYTLPETNIAPENRWLEDEFPFGMAYFQGRTVSFRECKLCNPFKIQRLPCLGKIN